jgi:hypothetical protein
VIDEKPKRKNDEDAFIAQWVKGEQNARRYIGIWFIFVTIVFFILVNPFQFFGSIDTGFVLFYLLLISVPAIGGVVWIVLSNNEDWIRKQVEKAVNKPDRFIKYAGIMLIVAAVLQFFSGGGEQKFLVAPCLLGTSIYWFWRNQQYQKYLALFGEEKA